MTDWAGQAAQKTLEQKTIRDQNTERSNQVAKIKAEAGPRLLRQLFDWLDKEVASYNDDLARGSDAADQLTVKMTQGLPPQMPDDEIVIARKDGKKTALTIRYSRVLGQLFYQSEGRHCSLTLKVGDDDKPFFETEDHQVMTIEQIGKELLDTFLAARY